MGPHRVSRAFLICSLVACGLSSTLTAEADPAKPATDAATSDFEGAEPPDLSAAVAPITVAPSPMAADAPTAPRPDRQLASEPSEVAEPLRAGPPAAPAEREWYGLPLLIVDGVYLGLIVAGRATKSDELVIVGAAAGITNGLLFHTYVYGEADFPALGKGLLSAIVRGGLAGGGCALGSGCGELSNPALVRLSIGLALGAALDAAFLAYRPRSSPSLNANLRLVPAISQHSFSGSLVGRF
jgi:hypothetical protein